MIRIPQKKIAKSNKPEIKSTSRLKQPEIPEYLEKRLELYFDEIGKADNEIKSKNKVIESESKKLEHILGSKVILFLQHEQITRDVVSRFYDKYIDIIKNPVKNLFVLVDSGGGDVDATYHLVTLFRKMTKGKLTFIVPRWAKSAATLLVCGGNEILMNDTSEIGPLDPQIHVSGRAEEFSPLAINEVTIYINKLIEEGKKDLANMLVDRMSIMQLGQYLRILNVSPHYLTKILKSRMLTNMEEEEILKTISEPLTKGYPHHGYCLLMEDAQRIGLSVRKPNARAWKQIWKIWKIHDEIGDQLAIKNSILKHMKEKLDLEDVAIRLTPEFFD